MVNARHRLTPAFATRLDLRSEGPLGSLSPCAIAGAPMVGSS